MERQLQTKTTFQTPPIPQDAINAILAGIDEKATAINQIVDSVEMPKTTKICPICGCSDCEGVI